MSRFCDRCHGALASAASLSPPPRALARCAFQTIFGGWKLWRARPQAAAREAKAKVRCTAAPQSRRPDAAPACAGAGKASAQNWPQDMTQVRGSQQAAHRKLPVPR